MKVKALKKVPVLIDGEIINIEPGKEYEVPAEAGEALLRGGDAEAVAEVIPPKVEEAPQKKNAGRAPMNKNVGKAPEDK